MVVGAVYGYGYYRSLIGIRTLEAEHTGQRVAETGGAYRFAALGAIAPAITSHVASDAVVSNRYHYQRCHLHVFLFRVDTTCHFIKLSLINLTNL